MKQNFKYYIIHNLEVSRYENTIKLLSKYGVDIKDVTFINHPNKNELTYDIKKKSVQKNSKIKDGWISCSYKHYLALEMIVNNGDDFAVIMEDNIGDFFEDIPVRLNKYLKELPDEWDVVYDSVWGDYEALNEGVIEENKLIYKKSNDITRNHDGKIISHGGYFSVFASIVLALSILIFDIYLIVICVILFGFGTANFLGIVLREGVKSSKEPLSLTVSNLLTMGFSGFIFGPALVGYSAEYFGLTFNMLALCLIWFLNSCLLIYIKK